MKNFLRDTHPELAKELIDASVADRYTFGSGVKVEWSCSNGHSYTATIKNRVNGSSCSYCYGSAALTGFNDFNTLRPALSAELLNIEDGSTVRLNSRRRAKWQCDRHGIYEMTFSERAHGQGCPKCGMLSSVRTRQNLAAINNPPPAELASQWSSENSTVLEDHSMSSHFKAWWTCPEHGDWQATIASRSRGAGCPQCGTDRAISKLAKHRNDGTFIYRPFHETKAFVSLAQTHPELKNNWSPQNDISFELVSAGSSKKAIWNCDSGHQWTATINDITDGHWCPHCAKSGRSKAELEIGYFVESMGFDVVYNNRTLIAPREVDIYVPEANLAIEYNGLYWHTEERVGRTLHRDKFLACQEKGVRLITLWEDDWTTSPALIKNLIVSKLGVKSKVIGARQTTARRITYAESAELLNRIHIQGSAKGSDYIGLFYNNILVGVAVFKKAGGGQARLERYASTITIIGGLDKCMAQCDYSTYVTFADLCVSDGDIYRKTGWVEDKVLKPDYMYIYKGKRIHKFNFRLKRFRDDPELLWQPGLSESELAALNNIPRVYDCGKIRYVKESRVASSAPA